VLGVEAGSPMRCDDPATGINESDLVLLLEVRRTTNLRTRAVNERAMQRWATASDKEDQQALKDGRAPVLPPAPEPRLEEVEARTIQAYAQVIGEMFQHANLRRKIPYQPWTPTVDDQVTRAPAIHYTAKSLPDREQVGRAAAAMRALWLPSTSADGRRAKLNGGRYAGRPAWRRGLRGGRGGPARTPRRRRAQDG
jgi:hypothetical protein